MEITLMNVDESDYDSDYLQFMTFTMINLFLRVENRSMPISDHTQVF